MSYIRNTSLTEMFLALTREHKPVHAFNDQTDFPTWKEEVYPKVMTTLGEFPERVSPNPELIIEWADGGPPTFTHI